MAIVFLAVTFIVLPLWATTCFASTYFKFQVDAVDYSLVSLIKTCTFQKVVTNILVAIGIKFDNFSLEVSVVV